MHPTPRTPSCGASARARACEREHDRPRERLRSPVVIAATPAPTKPRKLVSLRDVRASRAVAATRDHAGTVAHAWSLYAANCATVDIKHASAKKYRTAVTRATEGLPPRPHRGDVEAWLRALVAARGVSPATANFYLAALKAITNKAQHLEPRVLELRELASAFALVRPLRTATLAKRCPPRDALWMALDACANPAERAFVWLCASGLRKGEVLGLKPEDYDRRAKRLDVWRQRPDAHDRLNGRADRERKNGDHHYVTLDTDAARELEWTLAHYAEIRPRSGGHRGLSSGYVFPWSESKVSGLMKRIRAKAPGLERGTAWHGFRHLGASTVAELSNGHVQTVQRFLGDKSAKAAGMYCEPVRGHTEIDTSALGRALREAKRQADLLRSSPASFTGDAGEVTLAVTSATGEPRVDAHDHTPGSAS